MSDPNAPPLPAEIDSLVLTTSHDMARAYAELTADFNPIHLDPEFAAGTLFGHPIAHGTMALNLLLEAARRTFGGNRPAATFAIRFVKPVPIGETVRTIGRLSDAARGIYDVAVETEAGIRTLEGTLTVGPTS